MPAPPRHLSQLMVTTCLVLVFTGCVNNSPGEPQPLQLSPRATQDDLSGYWEKDYQRSDDFSNRFNLYIADIRRLQLQRQRGDLNGPSLRTGSVNADAINGLARFTEELTRMPALIIEQDEQGIRIDRETDFPLDCQWVDGPVSQSGHAFGRDVCGWDRQRLVFHMDITGGLAITHQFSLSPDADRLNVTTTVRSERAALPMTISNFYQRYTPPADDFDCTLTLTRSRVCERRLP